MGLDRQIPSGVHVTAEFAGDVRDASTHALHGRFDFIFWHVESL